VLVSLPTFQKQSINLFQTVQTTMSAVLRYKSESYNTYCTLDVRGSMHHSINYIEINNKMQLFTRIYYSNVY